MHIYMYAFISNASQPPRPIVVFTPDVLCCFGLAGIILKTLCKNIALVPNFHPPILKLQISKLWIEI